jgi:adenylylsulfate kinase
MKILIMGLPGSGKTTLAAQIVSELSIFNTVLWLNADEVREKYNDWDFSHEGRIRQGKRMSELAAKSAADFIVADFVAPLEEMREAFNADLLIWVDTITSGRFEDTNSIFETPTRYDVHVTSQDADYWSKNICEIIRNSQWYYLI